MFSTLFRSRKHRVPPASDRDELSSRHPDFTEFELDLIGETRATTMTSPERLVSLIRAVEHIVKHQVPGDIVECGVWRGGSMFAAASTLCHLNTMDRRLWLFDTFQGMSQPTPRDIDFQGQSAESLLTCHDVDDPQGVWCVSELSRVRQHLLESGYPENLLEFVVGPVESTLPQTTPEAISILRLDTDWYESTRCELEMLYPKLVPGGILIIDDYGHWRGCQRAVDEYFQQHQIEMLLQRIDYTGRIGVKTR